MYKYVSIFIQLYVCLFDKTQQIYEIIITSERRVGMKPLFIYVHNYQYSSSFSSLRGFEVIYNF